jgi:hypothetical protein
MRRQAQGADDGAHARIPAFSESAMQSSVETALLVAEDLSWDTDHLLTLNPQCIDKYLDCELKIKAFRTFAQKFQALFDAGMSLDDGREAYQIYVLKYALKARDACSDLVKAADLLVRQGARIAAHRGGVAKTADG